MERSSVGARFIEKHFSIFPKTIPLKEVRK
jgi:hypothetical protein